MKQDETLLEFPCDFPLKIMGARRDDFAQTIIAIILRHFPDFDPATTTMRPSAQGNYLGLTCVVQATSKRQLDDAYRELSAHPMVKFVL
jgi:putative lipoic acid-binding regulatory protein